MNPLGKLAYALRLIADTLHEWRYDDTTAAECALLQRSSNTILRTSVELANLATLWEQERVAREARERLS